MKYSYYPGCSLKGTAREYDESIIEVAGLLGFELEELPEWSCCGASSAHSISHNLDVRLSERNLDIAAAQKMDVVIACAACYQRMRHADYSLKQDPVSLGRESYEPSFEILHLTSLLSQPEMLDKIRESVKFSLSGMKVAAYYGCLSMRPPKITGMENYEQPDSMEKMVEALGGEPVRWSHKNECCGASLTVTKPEIVRGLVGDIVNAARRGGADIIVTDCPMCQANLESRQSDLAAADKSFKTIPAYFTTELIAAALSADGVAKWAKQHLIEAGALAAGLNPLQQA
jgi:heterodisulfide reductase subunit B2